MRGAIQVECGKTNHRKCHEITKPTGQFLHILHCSEQRQYFTKCGDALRFSTALFPLWTEYPFLLQQLLLLYTLKVHFSHTIGYRPYIQAIYLLNAIGLSPGGSSTVHIYTKTIHRTTQNKQYIEQHNNLGECRPCPVLARFTLAFALQLRKKHGK